MVVFPAPVPPTTAIFCPASEQDVEEYLLGFLVGLRLFIDRITEVDIKEVNLTTLTDKLIRAVFLWHLPCPDTCLFGCLCQLSMSIFTRIDQCHVGVAVIFFLGIQDIKHT